MNSLLTLAKNTFYNISAYVVSALVSFITLPFMLRAFGTSVYGVFMLAASTIGMIALLDFGLTTVLTKEVAQVEGELSRERLGNLVRTGAVWFTLVGLLAAALLFLISRSTWLFRSLTPVEFKLLQDMLLVHAASQLVIWPAKAGTVLLAGKQRFDVIAIGNLLSALLSAGVIVGVLLIGRGPLLIVGLTALATAAINVGLTLYAFLSYKVTPQASADRTQFTALSKRLFKLSMPIFVAQIAAFIMLQQMDRFVIGVFLSAAAVAIYEVAAKFSSLMFQTTSLLVSALPPFVAKLDLATTREEMSDFFIKSARYLSLALTPLHILLIAGASDIVRLWVGAGFAQGILAMRVLLLASLILPFYFTADAILVARDRYHRWAPYAVLTAVINLALSLIFVKLIGVVGVAVGTLISYLIDGSLYVRVTSREIGYSKKAWLSQAVVPALIVGAGAGAVCGVLCLLAPPRTLWAMAGYLLLGMIAAAVLCYAAILTPEERRMLRQSCARLLKRA